jgi:hypothetical protein
MKTRFVISFFFFIMLIFSAQAQWMYTDLTETKLRMASATLGTKAYFAGGDNIETDLNLVEIYDVADQSWSYAELSLARSFLVGASCGSKVIFAGGTNVIDTCYTMVDIYDTITDEWTTANLSAPRFLISVVAHGNKVLFAGGLNLGSMTASNVVDIYDVETGEWDTAYLSEARFAMGEAVAGDVAVFAGGDKLASFSDRVDLYNFTTNTWSTESLFLPRGYAAAAGAEDKIMVVGGMTDPFDDNSATNLIEKYDLSTGGWSFAEFPNPRAFIEPSVTMGDNIYFVGGGKFLSAGGTWTWSSDIIDIYNLESGNWSVDHLTHGLTNHTITSLETPEAGYLFVAGGATTQLSVMYSTVEILYNPSLGVKEFGSLQLAVVSYPNPTGGIFNLQFTIYSLQSVLIKIYDVQGREVAVLLDQKMPAGEHTVTWDASSLPAGIYYYRITTNDYRLTTSSGKMVVIR